MKQLFDETYSENRTLWYGYFSTLEQADLIDKLTKIIHLDLESSQKVHATSWIFYSEVKQTDALEEDVRSSIMVHYVEGQYYVHYNMSDFEFVTQREQIEEWLTKLKNQLS